MAADRRHRHWHSAAEVPARAGPGAAIVAQRREHGCFNASEPQSFGRLAREEGLAPRTQRSPTCEQEAEQCAARSASALSS